MRPAGNITSFSIYQNELSCWVTVAGLPASSVNYEENPNKATAFMEAKSDAPFVVHFKDNQVNPRYGVMKKLFLDGQEVTSLHRGEKDFRYERPVEHHGSFRYSSRWVFQALCVCQSGYY